VHTIKINKCLEEPMESLLSIKMLLSTVNSDRMISE